MLIIKKLSNNSCCSPTNLFLTLVNISSNVYTILNLNISLILSGLPPSQGGRYAGFGNTVDSKPNDQNDLLSSFTTVINKFIVFLKIVIYLIL